MRCIATWLPRLVFCSGLLLSSCSGDGPVKSHGPIVFGDSSTIVTEKDQELLKDNVTDFRQVSSIARDTVTAAVPVKDTAAKAVPKADTPRAIVQAAATDVQKKGLQIVFKPFTVFIPGIETRSFRQQDPANAKGVSYSLLKGKIEGNSLQVKGATVTRIVQRYQTVVVLKDKDAGNMLLQSLGTYSSDWQNLRGNGGTYQLNGLAKSQLKYNSISPSSLRNAIRKAAKNNRLSRKEEEALNRSVKNIRNTVQPPLAIVLQSVTWKITARDNSGKTFEKEVRIDMNVRD